MLLRIQRVKSDWGEASIISAGRRSEKEIAVSPFDYRAAGAAWISIRRKRVRCWRRKRDSNPRASHPANGFQDRRLQPLGHSSNSNLADFRIGWQTSGAFAKRPMARVSPGWLR